MKKLPIQAVLLFAIVSLSVTSVFAQSDADVKTKIEKLNKLMAEAMISGDMDKTMSLYTKDVISMPNYNKMISGIEGLKASNDEMKKSGWKITDFKADIMSVQSYGDIVTEIGTFAITMTMKGMEKPVNETGKYMTLWEKQKDGSLKIKAEIWNSDKYPMSE